VRVHSFFFRRQLAYWTIEALEPVLESSVPAINIVEMDRAAGPDPGAQINRFVSDASLAGEDPIGCGRVADQ